MKKLIYTLAGIAFFATSCDPVEEGYMSENVYYIENPYTVEQGSTVNSAALELDMSTTPVTVKLLDIRNVVTGMTEEAWYGDGLVVYWNDAPSVLNDTTLELLQAKYTMREYPIFKVNEIGGRLEFSRGTENVPLGEYEIDIVASNMRETRYIYNACNIILVAPDKIIDPISMDGIDYGDESGYENGSNCGLFRSGATSASWKTPYAYYDRMTSEQKDHLRNALDSVITQYEDYIPRENYMEQVTDEETGETIWTYRHDLSWVVVKLTDFNRAPFKWYRNHSYTYKQTISYDEIYATDGTPIKAEIVPIFNGEEVDPEWKPFDYYSPWLLPIWGGDYLICAYPVAPYPPTNIKEGMTYCRYNVRKNAVREDINGTLTWLLNYVVGREGMFVVEFQTDSQEHSLKPNEGEESETNQEYSGPVFRS
ncbi:MAG: hypothetical protein IKC67_05515 [Odoribacter sp.]|nr:hypothetical protein [Odoribacter sp.]